MSRVETFPARGPTIGLKGGGARGTPTFKPSPEFRFTSLPSYKPTFKLNTNLTPQRPELNANNPFKGYKKVEFSPKIAQAPKIIFSKDIKLLWSYNPRVKANPNLMPRHEVGKQSFSPDRVISKGLITKYTQPEFSFNQPQRGSDRLNVERLAIKPKNRQPEVKILWRSENTGSAKTSANTTEYRVNQLPVREQATKVRKGEWSQFITIPQAQPEQARTVSKPAIRIVWDSEKPKQAEGLLKLPRLEDVQGRRDNFLDSRQVRGAQRFASRALVTIENIETQTGKSKTIEYKKYSIQQKNTTVEAQREENKASILPQPTSKLEVQAQEAVKAKEAVKTQVDPAYSEAAVKTWLQAYQAMGLSRDKAVGAVNTRLAPMGLRIKRAEQVQQEQKKAGRGKILWFLLDEPKLINRIKALKGAYEKAKADKNKEKIYWADVAALMPVENASLRGEVVGGLQIADGTYSGLVNDLPKKGEVKEESAERQIAEINLEHKPSRVGEAGEGIEQRYVEEALSGKKDLIVRNETIKAEAAKVNAGRLVALGEEFILEKAA